MNNFQQQQQWPYQNLAFANNLIKGLQVPSNTQTVGTSYNPSQSYTASPLSSFVGTTLGASALSNGSAYAKGGKVRRRGALSLARA